MKWLKSFVFLVFIMGVGVLLERASIALYERGSKVDWDVIKNALLDDQKTIAAANASKEQSAPAKSDAPAWNPPPARPARHGTPTTRQPYELKKNDISREETPIRSFNPTRSNFSEPMVTFSEPSLARRREMPTLAIRSAPADMPTNEVTRDAPVPFVIPGPVASSEPTPVVSTNVVTRDPQIPVVMPGPVAASEPPPAASEISGSVPPPTPGPILASEPTPASAPPPPVLGLVVPTPADSGGPVVPFTPPVNPDKQGDADLLRVVCHLNSIPVNNLANELMGIFAQSPYQPAQYQPAQWSPIVIVAESASNSLLISGPKAKVEEAQRLAKEMDHPAAMVRLEVRITEVERGKVKKSDDAAPEKDKAADEGAKGDLHVVSTAEEGATLMHAAVTTLDNQAAQIFMGSMEPRVSGVMRSQGGMTSAASSMALGTQIDFTPRMDRDKTVVLTLKISDSRSGPAEEGIVIAEPKEGQPIRMPSTEQFKAETTVRLQDGKTLLLGGMTRDGKSGKELLISVTAHIVPMGD